MIVIRTAGHSLSICLVGGSPSSDTDSKVFRDRIDAGRRLARELDEYRNREAVVLGLPRGGVVIGSAVARELNVPLDIIVVRKLGAPNHRELGVGAISEHGVRVLNDDLIAHLRIPERALAEVERAERAELHRRVDRYRRGREETDLENRIAIIVDDGLATGYTARAAVQAARVRLAGQIVLAVPVAAEDTVASLAALTDRVVAVSIPRDFRAVGLWYRDFRQTTDREVLALLGDPE